MDFIQKARLKRDIRSSVPSVPSSPNSSMTVAPDSPLVQKKVAFSMRVKVVLIPTKEEYSDQNLFHDIWFGDHEYALFKSEASRELNACIREHAKEEKELSLRQAATLLYQPTKP